MDKFYLDPQGLPGTFQDDGTLDMGDSAAIYFNCIALNGLDESHVPVYMKSAPVRHPDETKWWGQQDRFSRDQLLPVLCWSILKDKANDPTVLKLFASHKSRLFLTAWNTKQNGAMIEPTKFPDITALEVWGLWLRIFKPFGYKLLLPVCDLETLVNSMLWRWYQLESNQITRNQMLVALAQRKHPSLISWIADRLNNYPDLIARWERNVNAVGEYPLTIDLFKRALK